MLPRGRRTGSGRRLGRAVGRLGAGKPRITRAGCAGVGRRAPGRRETSHHARRMRSYRALSGSLPRSPALCMHDVRESGTRGSGAAKPRITRAGCALIRRERPLCRRTSQRARRMQGNRARRGGASGNPAFRTRDRRLSGTTGYGVGECRMTRAGCAEVGRCAPGRRKTSHYARRMRLYRAVSTFLPRRPALCAQDAR